MPRVPHTPAKLARLQDSGYRGPIQDPYEVRLRWGMGELSDGAFKFYCAITAHRRGMYAEMGDREAEAWAHIDRHDIPDYIGELQAVVPAWFGVVRRESPVTPEHPGARSIYRVPYPHARGGLQPPTVDNSEAPSDAEQASGGLQRSTVEGSSPPVNLGVVKTSGRSGAPRPPSSGSPPAARPAADRDSGGVPESRRARPPAIAAASGRAGAPAASLPSGLGAVRSGSQRASGTAPKGGGPIRTGPQPVGDAMGELAARIASVAPAHVVQASLDALARSRKGGGAVP